MTLPLCVRCRKEPGIPILGGGGLTICRECRRALLDMRREEK